jgi:hypothetical protein
VGHGAGLFSASGQGQLLDAGAAEASVSLDVAHIAVGIFPDLRLKVATFRRRRGKRWSVLQEGRGRVFAAA